MGQAKRRGSKEDRIRQYHERMLEEARLREEARQKAKEEAQAWWDSLTPEQQEKEREEARKKKETNRRKMGTVGTIIAISALTGGWL